MLCNPRCQRTSLKSCFFGAAGPPQADTTVLQRLFRTLPNGCPFWPDLSRVFHQTWVTPSWRFLASESKPQKETAKAPHTKDLIRFVVGSHFSTLPSAFSDKASPSKWPWAARSGRSSRSGWGLRKSWRCHLGGVHSHGGTQNRWFIDVYSGESHLNGWLWGTPMT